MNPLRKYLERKGVDNYHSEAEKVAKKTDLSYNTVLNASRYMKREVDRMFHGTYNKFKNILGVDMDKGWEDKK